MITRSRKKKSLEDDHLEERSNIEELSVDLEIEILKKLPVKSLGRYLLVSKLWATIIHTRNLIRPRILVAFVDLDSQTKLQNWHFFSFSSSSSSSTSFLSRSACPFVNLNSLQYRSQYVKGLICLGYGPQPTICNLSTGKSITLPKVKTRIKKAKSFIGYDHVNDQYKVLCMMEKEGEPSSQHQVFTLGAKPQSWRMVDCSIPHSHAANGVCIDGVVYYVAFTWANNMSRRTNMRQRTNMPQWNEMRQRSLMRFDLKSEKLDRITSLSSDNPYADNPYGPLTLINYKGKVALVTRRTLSAFRLDVWVMDQDAENHVWLQKSFSLEPWKSLLQPRYIHLSIACATHTGDFVVVPIPSYYSDDVFLYNPDKNSFRRIKIEINGDHEFKPSQTIAVVLSEDYRESVRLL